MRGYSFLVAALAAGVVVALLVAAGPAATDAQARGCTRVDHPRDPGWAIVCNDNTIAGCDAQNDGHDTWVRYWPKQVAGGGKIQGPNPSPAGPQFPASTASIGGRDTFGRTTAYGKRYDRYGRRAKTFCRKERLVPALFPVGMAVCVSHEGCSKAKNTGFGN